MYLNVYMVQLVRMVLCYGTNGTAGTYGTAADSYSYNGITNNY